MLPIPLVHVFINCSESMVVTDSYSCRKVDIQYSIFLALCTAVFVLFVVMKLLKRKTQVNRNILVFMNLLIYVNFALAVCIFTESFLTITLGICSTLPHVAYGMPLTITISILRFISVSCLLIKNWLVAILSFLRLKLFNDSFSFSRFSFYTKLSICVLGFTAVVLAVPSMMVVKGQVCQHDPLGPVKVVLWHYNRDHTSWLERLQTFVLFPVQAILPVVLCFCCTIMTVHHIRTRPQDGQRSEATRAVVLLLVMFLVFCLTQTPLAVNRVLVFAKVATFYKMYWIVNVLVISDSIWNCVIYILLVNKREFLWTSNSSCVIEYNTGTCIIKLDAGERIQCSQMEEADLLG